MKKLLGISLLSAMLFLGQPFMALADTAGTTKVVNFEDIETIINEHNLDIQIGENNRDKSNLDQGKLKKTIRDLENSIDDLDSDRSHLGDMGVGLGAVKSTMLDQLKALERNLEDLPLSVERTDLETSISDNTIIHTAEGLFILYNQANLDIASLQSNLESLQKKLTAMQVQESLGMVSHNTLNELETSLVGLQTRLEFAKSQQDACERQLQNLLNDQENTLVIGGIAADNKDFFIEDQKADLEKALENNYAIKLQDLLIKSYENNLERTKKDNGTSSVQYRKANYDLTNAKLKLSQTKDTLKSSYPTMVDGISSLQKDLKLAEKILQDKKTAFSEAQLKMGLGMISQLEMDQARTDYQVQENAVKTKQVDLFKAKCNYEWFLKGMPQS